MFENTWYILKYSSQLIRVELHLLYQSWSFSRQIETIIQLSYFKSADFTTEKNYKPISILNSVSNSFEKLIQNQQNSFFKRLKKSLIYHPRAYKFSRHIDFISLIFLSYLSESKIFVFIEDSDRTWDEWGLERFGNLENCIMGVKYLGCAPSSFHHTRRFISLGAVSCSEDHIAWHYPAHPPLIM